MIRGRSHRLRYRRSDTAARLVPNAVRRAVAVVVSYDDYLRMTAKSDEHVTLPSEVVGLILAGKSTLRRIVDAMGIEWEQLD